MIYNFELEKQLLAGLIKEPESLAEISNFISNSDFYSKQMILNEKNVEDVFELKVEPIKNPVSGEPHRVRIDIPNGFEFTLAEMASGTTKTQGIVNLPNNNQSYSHLTELHWNNSGLIRS